MSKQQTSGGGWIGLDPIVGVGIYPASVTIFSTAHDCTRDRSLVVVDILLRIIVAFLARSWL